MPPVICVSYPRSGHHWLIRLATEYAVRAFGASPRIQRKNTNRHQRAGDNESFIEAGPFSYCEYYGHCRETPCRDHATVQKNHDFDLALEPPAGTRCLVLVREPLQSVTSYYDYVGRRHPWHDFAPRKGHYWCGFVDKWVLGSRPETVVVTYEDLVARPSATLKVFLHFCGIAVQDDVLATVPVTVSPSRGLDPTLDYNQLRDITASRYRSVRDAVRLTP